MSSLVKQKTLHRLLSEVGRWSCLQGTSGCTPLGHSLALTVISRGFEA